MPEPVETEEVVAAQAMVEKMVTPKHLAKDRHIVTYKKARTDESA